MRYRDPLVVITAIMEYNLYAFHIWTRHRSMRGLVIDLAKFQVVNITAYITYYLDTQERKYWDKDLIVKTPSPFGKSHKWAQFANILCNWMSTQFSVDRITPLVYLIRKEYTILYVRELNLLSRLYAIFYGIPSIGE